ncbi:L,D-transpeptidase family protein [Photobacterium leiognathi]|uniref:L,D-transpeptidase family protein n=1 Tax=Photobacterium leiognathi TaxID=553611 RepID=UPI002738ECF3|nr:L,D-transpeptidase family protein [Photobacterium leiognathi]
MITRFFLHDTPARGLFSKTKRDLSSGCVRVERAYDLANYVIDYQNRGNIPAFTKMLNAEKQKTVSLSKRIDVDFVYLTAWVDQNGKVQMREDIYGYDSPSANKIKNKFITMKDFVKN